jgi:hypothetical protein
MGTDCLGGSCNAACAAPLSACDGQCVDLQTNSEHCGLCDVVCGGDLVCEMGQCSCPAGKTDCAGTCVDFNTDKFNCGACATACAAGQVCSTGHCQ